MKELKLESRKPSERLRELVNRIPEIRLNSLDKTVEFGSEVIYDVRDGDIVYPINSYLSRKSPLRNVSVLHTAVKNDIRYISEASFCDVLEQHLALVKDNPVPEHWWETQEQMWIIVMGKFDYKFVVERTDIQPCNYGYISSRDGTIVFSSKEEATNMCFALNTTLMGGER